jgi:serine/threonine protein kinase
LAELIEERASAGKYFEESELWYVLYALAEVGYYCRAQGHRVGDLRPENVLMNKDGQIKVLTFLSFPNDLNPFM